MTLSKDFILFVKLIAGLGLDYIRWTQLVPMIIGWTFALAIVLAMTMVTFQGEIDSLLVRAESYAEQYFGPAPVPETNETQPGGSGTLEFSGDDVIPWILKIWGVLALLGWIFGLIRVKIFGPKPAKSLKKKIGFFSVAAMVFTGIIIFLYLLSGGVSGGSAFETILPFVLMPILLMIVSIWGLTISHVVDILHDVIDNIGQGEKPEDLIKSTV